MATSFSNPQTIPIAVDPATGQPYLLDSADGRFTSQISGPAMSPTLARQYDEQLVQDTLLRNQQALIAQREAIVAEARAREAALEAQRQRELAAAQAERDRLAAQPAPAAPTATPAGTEGTQAAPASPWQDPAFTGTKFASSFLATQKSGETALTPEVFGSLPFEERQKVVDAYVEQEVKARGMDPQRAAKFRDKARTLTYQDTGGKAPSRLSLDTDLFDKTVSSFRGQVKNIGITATEKLGFQDAADYIRQSEVEAKKEDQARFSPQTLDIQRQDALKQRLQREKDKIAQQRPDYDFLAATKEVGSSIADTLNKAYQAPLATVGELAGSMLPTMAASLIATPYAGAAVGAASGAAGTREDLYQKVLKADFVDPQSASKFAALVEKLGSETKAREFLAREAVDSPEAMTTQAVVGAIEAGGATRGAEALLRKGASEAAKKTATTLTKDTLLNRAMAKAGAVVGPKTLRTAGVEALEEVAVAIPTQVGENVVVRGQGIDPTRPVMAGVGSAVGESAVMGAFGGAGAGRLFGGGAAELPGAGSTLPTAPAGQPPSPITPPAAQDGAPPADTQATTPAAPAGTLSFADIEARLPPGLLDEEVATIRTVLAQAQPATQAEWEAALTQTVGEPVVLRNPAPAEPTQTTTVITSTGAAPLQAAAPATPTPAATPAPIQTTTFNVDNLQAAQQQLQALQQGTTPTPAAVQQAQAATANGSPDNAGAAPTGSLSNIMERTQGSMAQTSTAGFTLAPLPQVAVDALGLDNQRNEAVANVERLLTDIDNGTLPARPDMVAMMAQTVGVPVGASNPETLNSIRQSLTQIKQTQQSALTDPYSGWFDQVGTTNDADPELAALVQAADVDQQQQTAITSAQTTLATEGSVVDQQTTAETEAEILVAQQQVESTVNQILPSTLDAMPLKRFPRKQGQTKDDFLKVMKQLDSGNPLQKQAARAKLLNTANFAGNGTAALKAYDAINSTIQQMEAMGLAKTKNCG